MPDYAELRIETSFQSRFGPAQWLEPATDHTLEAEGAKGTKRMAIAAPGFSADCVETLEELAIEGKALFEEAGGEQLAVLSCLNTSDAGMDMLEAIMRRELAGWIRVRSIIFPAMKGGRWSAIPSPCLPILTPSLGAWSQHMALSTNCAPLAGIRCI